MCFGAIGDAIQGLDKVISPLVTDPLTNEVNNSLGKAISPGLANFGNRMVDHPIETAVLAPAAYMAGTAVVGGGEEAAGLGGTGEAGATLPADASAAAPSTASGFGGVGTDAAVAGPGAATPGWVSSAETAGKVIAPAVISSLLAPKPPKTKAPTAMPDPLAEQQATQQQLIAQMARRGRASTILTNPSNAGGSLGG